MQSQAVPTKSAIVAEFTRCYLNPYGSRYYNGWVTRFFNDDRPGNWGRLWVRTAYLALSPGTLAGVPVLDQEWHNRLGDMDWYQEVWVCLNDGRTVARNHTGEGIRRIGTNVLWMNTFQDFW